MSQVSVSNADRYMQMTVPVPRTSQVYVPNSIRYIQLAVPVLRDEADICIQFYKIHSTGCYCAQR